MITQKEKFVEADRKAARHMVAAAAAAGLKRIIYLGGLAEARHGDLSRHLKSRFEVARILQSGPVPATDLLIAACARHHAVSLEHCDTHLDRVGQYIKE